MPLPPEPLIGDDLASEGDRDGREPVTPRLFVREAGWTVAVKVGSERTYCHAMAPGEDYYHRIADAEVYLHHADQRLCLPCADRLGLLNFEPKRLRPAMRGVDVEAGGGEDDYPLGEVR